MSKTSIDREEFTLEISEAGARDLARYHFHHMLRHAGLYFISAVMAAFVGVIFGGAESTLQPPLVLIMQVAAFACAALGLAIAVFYLCCVIVSAKGFRRSQVTTR
jgi:hypothetical protein